MAKLKTTSLQVQGKKWEITRETETDEGGNKQELVIARSGNEVHRFSPNITDAELLRFEKNDGFVSIAEENN